MQAVTFPGFVTGGLWRIDGSLFCYKSLFTYGSEIELANLLLYFLSYSVQMQVGDAELRVSYSALSSKELSFGNFHLVTATFSYLVQQVELLFLNRDF
jgi:hypothetical protein